MLKRVTSRAPFPAPVRVQSLSSESITHTARKPGRGGAKTLPRNDCMLSVEFASSEKALENVPLGFKNEAGMVFLDSERQRLVASLGSKPTVRDYRLAVTSAVREAQKLRATALLLKSLPREVHTMGDLFQPPTLLSEGDILERTTSFAVTAAYKYDRMQSNMDNKDKAGAPMKLYIDSTASDAISNGNIIGDCINDARNMGNLRQDEGIPQLYCEWIQKELTPLGVKVCHVLRGERLQKAGLNLMYSVGKGSRHEPYLVVFEYMGNRGTDGATALVGKGVTFDSGGLNLKPYGSMETMHMDMMGAATVIAAMKAIAALRLPVNVVGAVGLVENAIGPDSYHPSSIITSRKGLTVEVLNTDAEGRLVLADTLTFVQRDARLKKKLHTVIDLATLTGATLIGLGSRRAGLFSNDLQLSQHLMASGRSSGDEIWPMPVGEEHHKAVKGGIADLVNVSPGREAGSCTAAAFLSNFVEDGMKWAHLDIAGPAMGGNRPKGFQPAGAPGFGVQLLVDHFRQKLMDPSSQDTTTTTATPATPATTATTATRLSSKTASSASAAAAAAAAAPSGKEEGSEGKRKRRVKSRSSSRKTDGKGTPKRKGKE